MQDLLSIGTNRRESMIGTGIGLGLAGYRLNPPGGPLPVLDLRFATDKSLTAFSGPTPSFSRASSGTYFDSNGVLQSAGVNAPRFNHTYNGTSWVSRGLLVEEQRTNLCLYSNPYAAALDRWGTSNATLTANAVTSPDGTQNASSVVGVNAAPFFQSYYYFNQTSGTYTQSFFLKSNGANIVGVIDFTGNAFVGWYDLLNGTTQSGSYGGVTYSTTITNVGSGWYRCAVTNQSAVPMSWIHLRPVTAMGGSTSTSGDGVKGFYVYGVQVESGSFATSLIPTNGSSTTRSADVCQITGGDFTSFWNASEGSFAFDADALNPNSTASGQTVYSFDDGSSANSIYGLRSGNTAGSDYLVLSYTSGVEKVNFSNPAGTWLANVPFKNAIGFKLNDFAQSVNGGAVVTDTNCTMPVGVNQLSIGRLSYAGYPLNGHISRLRYYPTRLTNAKLQELST